MSCVTCHELQQPLPDTLPLLTLTLCTVGWFPKKSFYTWEPAFLPKPPFLKKSKSMRFRVPNNSTNRHTLQPID